MADIILGNNFKIYYNTDTGNSSLQGINNILIDNLAAFPTFTISSTANQFDTYDSDYLTTLLSEQTLEPLSISIRYVPDNSTAVFLDEMSESHDEFQLVMVYDFDTSAQTISGAITNGRISSYSTTGDKDEVLTRTYTFVHNDVVMRAMTVAASVPIYQGDYGIGSNTTDIAQYQPDVPTGNSFIKVPAAQSGNPTGTDLMGIGLVDGTNVAEFAMTKSGTLSLFAKNANTAWTRIYTVTQMDSTYVPLTRTVNGKPLSGNVVLNASDLAGGTMTGALTVPGLTVTGTTTLSGNTAATAVTATSLTSTGSTATDSLSVSGTTALAGVTTAGTINASTLNVSGNTVHTGTTKLNGVTTAGTVNAGATTATSLSVSGDTTHTGTTTLTGLTTAGTVNAEALTVSGNTTHTGTTTLTGTTTAGTVNAGATTATSLSVSGSSSLEDVTAGTVNASDLTLINALPVTQGGTGNTNGTVGQLTTARTFVTNLASTTAASFNGTANNSHGVTGILPISNGGTGNNTGNAPTATLAASANVLSTARNITTDLGSTTAASFNGSANITPGVSGVLPITSGGTGAITAAAARTNLGLGTAATVNTGTSGATIPLLNAGNTFSGTQIFSSVVYANAGFEVGSLSAVSTQIIDFHTSGNNIDYDSRIAAYGGNGTVGAGNIDFVATNVNIPLLNLSTPLAIASGGTGANTAANARTNLGLGGAAILNVGTVAGTVAAGNDSRFTTITGMTGGTVTGDVRASLDSGTASTNIDAGKFISGYSGYLTPHYSYFTHRYDSNYGSYAYIALVPGTTAQFFRFLADGRFQAPALESSSTVTAASSTISGALAAGSATVTGAIVAGGVRLNDGAITPQGLHINWNSIVGGGSSFLVNNAGTGGTGGFVFANVSSAGTETGRVTFSNTGAITAGGNVAAGAATYYTTGNVTGSSWNLSGTTDLVTFLAKSYAPISDRRIKTNIVPVNVDNAISEVKSWKTYDYEFIYGKSGRGIIADEVDQKYVTETNVTINDVENVVQVDQLGMLMANVPPVLQYLLDKVEALENEISEIKNTK